MKKNSKIHNIIIILFLIISSSLIAQTLTVNGIRDFSIDNNTIVRKDGVIVSQPSIIIGTGGFKVQFRVAKDVNPTISQGTLVELDLISDIKGPVTSLGPLRVLDQRVFTTAETVLDNIASVASLQQGDIVSVSGAINSGDNSMQLSRLELNNTLTQWKLRGFARNITATDFTIGSLVINTNAVTATDCINGFVENVFVEIKATPDASYVTGNALTTLTSIQCQTPDVYQDPNDSIPVVVEAMVSEIIDLSSFRINDLVIFFDANTSFDNGEVEHIDVGTKLEIQGTLDTNTRFITAATIRFVHHRVKFVAPIMPADITIGESITFFGKQIFITPQTRDDDIISSGLSSERQIEVRGFMDSAGNLFARRVKDKGTPDSQDIELRGDITAINQPTVELNGISIDASTSLFEIDDDYVDINVFFSMIQVGMQMEIEEAVYDASTQIISGGTIELVEQELEDNPDGAANTTSSIPIIKEIIGIGGIGLATVTKVEIIELIFGAGFE